MPRSSASSSQSPGVSTAQALPRFRLRWALLLAAAGGFAGDLAFPTFDVWPLAAVAVAALSVAVHGRRARTGALLGLVWGLALFVPLISWTGIYVGPAPWLILATAEAAYVALLGVALPTLQRGRLAPLWVGLAWVADEALRSRWPFGGFPWGRWAFSQSASPLRWFAALGGAPLVGFVVALAGGALAVVALRVRRRAWRPPVAPAAVFAAVPVLALALAPVLTPAPARDQPQAVVALVQGDVPRQGLQIEDRARQVLDNHVQATLDLAAQVAAGRARQPDLVVWPENASDVDPYADGIAAAAITQAAVAVRAPILVGAIVDGPGDDHISNTAILWSPTTGPGASYVKRHPVPFAEYIPWRTLARAVSDKVDLVPRDMAAGHGNGLLTGGPFPIGDVICFEVAYDGLVRSSVRAGAQVLVVQTNNATFGFTAETYQQLAMSRLRAVETGRTVLPVSTTGVSAVIGADGRIQQRTGTLFTRQVLVGAIPLRTTDTLATRVGSWPEYVMTAGALLGWLALGVARRRARGGGTRGSTGHRDTGSHGDHGDHGDHGRAGSRSHDRSAAMTDARNTLSTLVIVPTYNEAENVESIVRRVRAVDARIDVLVVDDGSPDGTGEIADRLAAADDHVHVLHRTAKAGLGAAYIAGFAWGLDADYDVLVEMDADGSHAPEQLPTLLARLDTPDHADLVLGSRWVRGGSVVDWPRSRELLSRGGNLYTRIALGVGVHDITGGYRAYRRQVLEKIDYRATASEGYCFQVDLAWRALQAGFVVQEVPIRFQERQYGTSKMSGSIVREAYVNVSTWGVRHRAQQLSRLVRRARRSR